MRAASPNDVSPDTDCEGCGQKIGTCTTETGAVLTNDFVVCLDGISQKVVTFHKTCHMRLTAPDPDLQRHHHIGLAPKRLGLTGSGIV